MVTARIERTSSGHLCQIDVQAGSRGFVRELTKSQELEAPESASWFPGLS